MTLHGEEWRRNELENYSAVTRTQVAVRLGEGNTPPRRLEQAKLAVRGVSKHFRVRGGQLEALTNVTLSVHRGEFICLVGPSGCGKSTLLSIVAGLEHPSRGQVFADGRLIEGPGPDRIIMFQEPALFPWLTVQQNVAFGLRIRGLGREERALRALEGLRQVGLSEFARSYVHQLSGGMKQRAALARALVLDPDMLLLDEPFASLDLQSRDLLHEELLQVWARTGKTILFVTHQVPEALSLADRIVVFSPRPGRVVREYLVHAPRPRPIEQGALRELGEEIRHELRMAFTPPFEGGGNEDAWQSEKGYLLPGADCPMGTGV